MSSVEPVKNFTGNMTAEGRAKVTVAGLFRRRLIRTWRIGLTRFIWGRRLHSLGARSVLRRSLEVNNPRAVAIGSCVSIMSQFILVDLCPNDNKIPKIVIGDGCIILYRFQCNAGKSIRIGQNVLIASNVLIADSDHVVESDGLPVTKNAKFVMQPVCIEDNCWIGQNAVILKGVTVGHDSIVGANSVVTHDVPPCSVVAGNPARLIRSLKSRSNSSSTYNESL